MYIIYDNESGEYFYIVNSTYGLNQCMNYLEKHGKHVSYEVFTPALYEATKSVQHWQEK